MTKRDEAVAPPDPADEGGGDPARLRKHSVTIAGHRTSISLEDAFWTGLEQAARRRGASVTSLVTAIDAGRTGNLSSAIRVFVLTDLEDWVRITRESGARPPPGK